MPTVFSDQTPSTTGTNLNAANLNALVTGLTNANLSGSAGITAANIATVNGSSLVMGIRQINLHLATTDISCLNTNSSLATVASWGQWSAAAVTCTLTGVQASSSLLCFVTGVCFNSLSSSPPNWIKFGAYGTGQTNVTLMCANFAVPNLTGYNFSGMCLLTGLSGTVTVSQVMNTGGPGSANWTQVNAASDGINGRGDCLLFVVMEIA